MVPKELMKLLNWDKHLGPLFHWFNTQVLAALGEQGVVLGVCTCECGSRKGVLG